MPGATADDYAATLEEIFESVVAGVDVLEPGIPVTGLEGPAASAHLYRIEVPVGTTALRLLSAGGSGNVTLQAKFGAVPSDSSHDFISQRPGNNEVIHITTPTPGTYYVRLLGVMAYSGVSLQGRLIN